MIGRAWLALLQPRVRNSWSGCKEIPDCLHGPGQVNFPVCLVDFVHWQTKQLLVMNKGHYENPWG